MAYIYDDSQTYTGGIVNFTSTDKANITSVSVPLTYSQDLHGYANPWPAGGGVNKYDIDNWPYTTTRRFWGTEAQSFVNALNALPAGTYTITAKIKIDALTDTSGNRTYGFLCTGVSVDGRKTIATPAVGTVVSVSKTFTLSSAQVGTFTHCYWYAGTSSSTSDTATISEIGINVGSDDTYYPYSNICPLSGRTGLSVYVSPTQDPDDATVYNVDWTTQAGTVYGGTLDVVTGVLTVTHISTALPASNPAVIGTYSDRKDCGWSISGKAVGLLNVMAEGFETKAVNGVPPIGCVCGRGANTYVTFGVPIEYASTAADARAYIAQNTSKIVYELATPLTYQLTPKQISALTENYVWASNGASITVVVSDILHDFQGWLLKVGSGMTLVPTEMIKAETYKVSPNQRMEETAERDSTGVLWRETVPNMPPKIEFNTPAAYDTDVNALNAIFRAAYSNEQERKLTVAFYDPEENVYKSWECYMPNIDFPIRTIDIDAKTIFYDEIRYAFIGY